MYAVDALYGGKLCKAFDRFDPVLLFQKLSALRTKDAAGSPRIQYVYVC